MTVPSNRRTAVTRGQFAKMAVNGLDLLPMDPAVATFKDVAKGSTFYTFIEGARAESLIGGYATPDRSLLQTGRQHHPAADQHHPGPVSLAGGTGRHRTSIHGVGPKTYLSMEEWYLWEGSFYIEGFLDDEKIAPDHRAATAYLVFRDVVQGSGGYLNPNATLNRAQAAVMVLQGGSGRAGHHHASAGSRAAEHHAAQQRAGQLVPRPSTVDRGNGHTVRRGARIRQRRQCLDRRRLRRFHRPSSPLESRRPLPKARTCSPPRSGIPRGWCRRLRRRSPTCSTPSDPR